MFVRDLIFVGYTTSLRPDANIWLPEFQANKNVVKAETAERQIEAKRQALLEVDGPTIPFFGQLTSVYMYSVNSKAKALFNAATKNTSGSSTTTTTPIPTTKPLGWLIADQINTWAANVLVSDTEEEEELKHHDQSAYLDGEYVPDIDEPWTPYIPSDRSGMYFVGFDIRAFTKMAGLEAAAAGKPLLSSLWYNNNYIDVLSLIQPDRRARQISPNCAFSGLGFPGFVGNSPGNDIEADALLAMQIIWKLGIVPSLSEPMAEAMAGMQPTKKKKK